MSDQPSEVNLLEVTSQIVTAHVSNNSVVTADLPHLINRVHQALASLGQENTSSGRACRTDQKVGDA